MLSLTVISRAFSSEKAPFFASRLSLQDETSERAVAVISSDNENQITASIPLFHNSPEQCYNYGLMKLERDIVLPGDSYIQFDSKRAPV